MIIKALSDLEIETQTHKGEIEVSPQIKTLDHKGLIEIARERYKRMTGRELSRSAIHHLILGIGKNGGSYTIRNKVD